MRACKKARVHWLTIKRLLNHAKDSRDVTEKHYSSEEGDLFEATQAAADKLDKQFGLVKAPEPVQEPQQRVYQAANGNLAREAASNENAAAR